MLKLRLQAYNVDFNLPKTYIQTELSESILASALQDDPYVDMLTLSRPEVTPHVMRTLVDLSMDRSQQCEPVQHNPQLTAAHRYLNLPRLLCYADPLYTEIPNRNVGNAPENRAFIQRLIEEDRCDLFVYLVRKGYQPTLADFTIAVETNASRLTAFLLERLPPADLNPKDLNAACKEAASRGYTKIVHQLLANPRVNPGDDDNYALRWAAWNGHTAVVKRLIEDPRVNPAVQDNLPIMNAYKYGHRETVRVLLSNPRVTQAMTAADITTYTHYIE